MTGFPFHTLGVPEHTGPLPAGVDVVIIGGGIVGVMSAWFLHERGLRVLVCEKGRIAGEQSSRNWGWIRQQGRDPDELPIMVEARRIWQGLPAATGADLGLVEGGVAYLAESAAALARYEAWLPHGRAHGLDTEIVAPARLAELLPGGTGGWAGAMWTASDCRAEPWVAVPAIARALAGRGAKLRECCAVRALDIAAGRVAGVVTEAGRVRASAVVLAGGAWSGLFARAAGVALPQLSVRASVAATAPLPEVFAGGATDDHVAFRRRADGGYSIAAPDFHEVFLGPDAFRHFARFWPLWRADAANTRLRPAAPRGWPDGWFTPRRWSADRPGPFEALRILDPAPNRRRLARVARDFARRFPALGPVRLRHSWAGMIDTMPDVVPVIDHVAALPGLVIATGMSGHGFGIGPGIGRVVADLVAGNPVGHDLSRFRLGRFSDGSALSIGPAL